MSAHRITPPDAWLDSIQPERSLLRGPFYQAAKRTLDLALCLASLPLALPLLVLCAVAVKLESPRDPILVAGERTGRGGRRFRIYKFRTLLMNADTVRARLEQTDDEDETPLLAEDPRVARIGRLLRRTRLERLPQIISILKGDMSWVGPRPTAFGLKAELVWHADHLDVLPGITGLRQLYGRADSSFDSWLRWDVRYLEKRCLWLDIQILARTLLLLIRRLRPA